MPLFALFKYITDKCANMNHHKYLPLLCNLLFYLDADPLIFFFKVLKFMKFLKKCGSVFSESPHSAVVHTFSVKLLPDIASVVARSVTLPCKTLSTELMKLDFPAPTGP